MTEYVEWKAAQRAAGSELRQGKSPDSAFTAHFGRDPLAPRQTFLTAAGTRTFLADVALPAAEIGSKRAQWPVQNVSTALWTALLPLITPSVSLGQLRVAPREFAPPLPEVTQGTGSVTRWQQRTPAMAAGLTDRVWSLREVLLYRVPPWPQPQGG
jgi:hypothetical protein